MVSAAAMLGKVNIYAANTLGKLYAAVTLGKLSFYMLQLLGRVNVLIIKCKMHHHYKYNTLSSFCTYYKIYFNFRQYLYSHTEL